MSSTKISSFIKMGFTTMIPENTNIDNYEIIHVKENSGKETKLYRYIESKKKIDEVSNFNRSWEVFNSHLD